LGGDEPRVPIASPRLLDSAIAEFFDRRTLWEDRKGELDSREAIIDVEASPSDREAFQGRDRAIWKERLTQAKTLAQRQWQRWQHRATQTGKRLQKAWQAAWRELTREI
jgi:hypothetical protein